MQFACEVLIYVIVILVVRLTGIRVMKRTNNILFKVYRSTEELIIVVKENGNQFRHIEHKHGGHKL